MCTRFFVTVFFACILRATLAFSAPQITALSDNKGSVNGGNNITITGTDLSGATSVNFGTNSIPVGSFISSSSTQITVQVPGDNFGTVDVTVVRGAETSPVVPEAQYTYQGNWYAYVTTGPTKTKVLPVNLATAQVLPSIPVPSAFGVGFTPDGRTAYVTGTGTTISKIATNTATVNQINLPPGMTLSEGVVVSPDGNFMYTIGGDAIPTFSLLKMDVSNNVFTPFTLTGAQIVFDLVCTPDGSKVYMFGQLAGSVLGFQIFDVASSSLGTPVGGFAPDVPTNAAVLPNGKAIFISDTSFPKIFKLTPETSNVDTVPASMTTFYVSITSDGKYVFFTNPTSDTMIRFRTSDSTLTQFTVVSTDSTPRGLLSMATSPDSKTVYVVDTAHKELVPVDTETLIAGIAIPLNETLDDSQTVAISPDQSPVASFSTTVSNTNVTFDASKSVSPVGSIVSYAWDFGDGASQVVTTPTVSHDYGVSGTYSVSLTVTNSAGTSVTQLFTGHVVSNQGSARAKLTKSVTVTGGQVVARKKFEGKLLKINGSHYVLKTKWSPIAFQSVVAYEIFADNVRIAKISSSAQLLFSVPERNVYVKALTGEKPHVVFKLNTKDYYKDNLHKYKKYLEKKYKIRAVFANGAVSGFTFLKMD